jgi:hypothetical protein
LNFGINISPHRRTTKIQFLRFVISKQSGIPLRSRLALSGFPYLLCHTQA